MHTNPPNRTKAGTESESMARLQFVVAVVVVVAVGCMTYSSSAVAAASPPSPALLLPTRWTATVVIVADQIDGVMAHRGLSVD